MIPLGGIILGLINIIIVVAIFLLIGAIVMWVMDKAFGWPVPQLVQRLYIAVVALIALYLLVRLLLGVPFTIVGRHASVVPDRPVACRTVPDLEAGHEPIMKC